MSSHTSPLIDTPVPVGSWGAAARWLPGAPPGSPSPAQAMLFSSAAQLNDPSFLEGLHELMSDPLAAWGVRPPHIEALDMGSFCVKGHAMAGKRSAAMRAWRAHLSDIERWAAEQAMGQSLMDALGAPRKAAAKTPCPPRDLWSLALAFDLPDGQAALVFFEPPHPAQKMLSDHREGSTGLILDAHFGRISCAWPFPVERGSSIADALIASEGSAFKKNNAERKLSAQASFALELGVCLLPNEMASPDHAQDASAFGARVERHALSRAADPAKAQAPLNAPSTRRL